jgi:hypothetical protein
MRFVVDKVALEEDFLRIHRFFPVNIIPSYSSYSYVILRLNNRPVGGPSSETSSQPIDTNNNKFISNLRADVKSVRPV